jgi:stearoyl-CoA desaturase (delta-9 desaturase)
VKIKFASRPDKADVIEKLESEYELLHAKMTEFYQIKKRYIEIKKKKLVRDMNKSDLFKQMKELKSELDVLKIGFYQQKREFLHLVSLQHQS